MEFNKAFTLHFVWELDTHICFRYSSGDAVNVQTLGEIVAK